MAASTLLRAGLDELAATLQPACRTVALVQAIDGILIIRSEDEPEIVPLLAAGLAMALDCEAGLIDRAREMTPSEWQEKLFGP